LKLSIQNYSQTAAVVDMVTIDSQRPIRRYYRQPSMTYRLATILHDWHSAL